MKPDNPFDSKLDAAKRLPDHCRAAFVDITDTLDFCWAAAQSVFQDAARPEHALALLPQFLQRADAERQQARAQRGAGKACASTPPARTARSRPKA
jgi:hypothetical protein